MSHFQILFITSLFLRRILVPHSLASNLTDFQQFLSSLISLFFSRHPTMAAGAHGDHGVHVQGLVAVECSLPSASVTIHHLEIMAATAQAREPSIGPAMSPHVHLQVSINALEQTQKTLSYLYIQSMILTHFKWNF